MHLNLTVLNNNYKDLCYRKRLNSGPGPLIKVRLESMRHQPFLSCIYFSLLAHGL